MNDTEGLWILCAEALREQVSDASWQAYLAGINPVAVHDDVLALGVPNSLIRERVESRFLGLIEDTVSATVNRTISVQLEVELHHRRRRSPRRPRACRHRHPYPHPWPRCPVPRPGPVVPLRPDPS